MSVCAHGIDLVHYCPQCHDERMAEQARGMMNAASRPTAPYKLMRCPHGNDTSVVCDECKKQYARLLTGGEAVKHDGTKTRVELLPFPALEAAARVFTYGAKKYADHNYRKGMQWSRLLGAALRHLFAWARGENTDPESGEPHLAHAACCVLMLLDAEVQSLGTDDRWRKG